jgi:hypothetical protein
LYGVADVFTLFQEAKGFGETTSPMTSKVANDMKVLSSIGCLEIAYLSSHERKSSNVRSTCSSERRMLEKVYAPAMCLDFSTFFLGSVVLMGDWKR